MLTSKQRASLRSEANKLQTILQVGKQGVGQTLIKQTGDALTARELIKGRVLDNTLLSAKEVAATLAEHTKAEVVFVMGTRFVLYRQNEKPKQS